MSSARERTGRERACEVDGCPGCEDCPGGRHYERSKGLGKHNHIRVQTRGMPMTLSRMNAGSGAPRSWAPSVKPTSTIGDFLVSMLAHLHQVQ